MRRENTDRPRHHQPQKKTDQIPRDLQEALQFAVLYRLHKEQENLTKIVKKQTSHNKSVRQNKKPKKSALFERRGFQKAQQFSERPPKTYNQPNQWNQPQYQQQYFTRQKRNKPEYKDTKQLSQFITQLETRTVLYSKADQSIFDIPQTSQPNKFSAHTFQPQNKKAPNFDSIQLSTFNRKQEAPKNQILYSTSIPRENLSQTRHFPQKQQQKYYKYPEEETNINSVQKISNLNYPNYNQRNYFQQSHQTPISKTNVNKTEFTSQNINNREGLDTNSYNRRSNIMMNSLQASGTQSTLPVFGGDRIKVHDFTNNRKIRVDDIQTEEMIQSSTRPFYHPSPTRSSATPRKKLSKRHQVSASSQSQKDSPVYKQTYYTKMHQKTSSKKETNRAPLSRQQVTDEKQKQPNNSFKQSKKFRQSLELDNNITRHSKDSQKHQLSSSPTPRSQNPKPSSTITEKVSKPKASVNRRDDKRICRLSETGEEKKLDFGSEFSQQLSELQSTKTVRQLDINLRSYTPPYLPSSQQQSYQQQIYQTHKLPVPSRTKFR